MDEQSPESGKSMTKMMIIVSVIIVLIIVVILVIGVYLSIPKGPQELKRGETFKEQLVSPNGKFGFVERGGNFLVVKSSQVVWSTGTTGAKSRFVHQNDGNLVVYNAGGQPTWASGTSGRATTTLKLMDTGKLVLLDGDRLVWSS
jgi:hypothetical protein